MIKPLFLYHVSLDDACFAVPNGRFVCGLKRKFSYQKFESNFYEPKERGKMEKFNPLGEYWLLCVPTVLALKNSTRWSHCVCVFCTALRTNSDISIIQH
jgi:hypothetical protein